MNLQAFRHGSDHTRLPISPPTHIYALETIHRRLKIKYEPTSGITTKQSNFRFFVRYRETLYLTFNLSTDLVVKDQEFTTSKFSNTTLQTGDSYNREEVS